MWVDVIRYVVEGDSDGCQKQKTFAANYSFVAAFQTRLFFSKTVRQRRYIWVCFSDVRYNIVANPSGASKRRLTALSSDMALAPAGFQKKSWLRRSMKNVFKVKKAGTSFREKVILVDFRCEKMKEQERRAGWWAVQSAVVMHNSLYLILINDS